MVDNGKQLVQASMFEFPGTPGRAPERRVPVRRGGGRVTRDPEVAIAHEEAYRYAHGVKLGLARILASRGADERASLRAQLGRGRVA